MKLTKDNLQQLIGRKVRLISFCNPEPRYQKGDTGVITYVDDANQLHVSWDDRGSLALIPPLDRFEIMDEKGEYHEIQFD